MTNRLSFFTDGSVNPRSGTGYGAYLIVTDVDLAIDKLKSQVKVQQFENTSSTRLELQILLFALKTIDHLGQKVIIYTDSQNIVRLPSRQSHLEDHNYLSKKGKLIKNHLLYQEFYAITQNLECEIIKIKGHKPSKQKNKIDQIFNLVDKRARVALRSDNIIP
ncbi:MAG: ribonuclease H [Gammaproteobacteria bacterium]|nr:ribonuclease H [Gammaproteobacteria bacterium]